MSNYPAPPAYPAGATAKPTYGTAGEAAASEPLLGYVQGQGVASSSAAHNAYFNQPDDDLPDDFKYGTSTWEATPDIRNAFVKKVYSILFVQILGTCIVGGTISSSPRTVFWVQSNPWAFFLPLIGTFVSLGFLYWKRHNHPWNLALLATFTLFESFSIGLAISFYDQKVVLQALIMTLGVFLGLTLFTLQSKYDFVGMGPYLFGGLMVLIMSGFVSLIFPFSQTADLVYSIIGCLIFSGYIVYDTSMIMRRLSPDEYIMGAISLYLDFINLFLNILRVLNNANRD